MEGGGGWWGVFGVGVGVVWWGGGGGGEREGAVVGEPEFWGAEGVFFEGGDAGV